jgi:hypothetical protein
MKTRQEIEKGVYDKILKSISMANPANDWTYISKRIHDNNIHNFVRRDGLEIVLSETNRMLKIIKPVEFSFEDWRFQKYLVDEFSKFIRVLNQDMERKVLQDKLDVLSDFFDLDLMKQRKNKLNRINENENRR